MVEQRQVVKTIRAQLERESADHIYPNSIYFL